VESAGTEGRTEAEPAADEAVEATADDGAGIPKQQSAQEAADSEAGEGART
jgi:protein-tyrosine-phosphatase